MGTEGTRRRSVNLYEFKVDGIRYTGQDRNSEVGNYIEIAYLPKAQRLIGMLKS